MMPHACMPHVAHVAASVCCVLPQAGLGYHMPLRLRGMQQPWHEVSGCCLCCQAGVVLGPSATVPVLRLLLVWTRRPSNSSHQLVLHARHALPGMHA